MSSSLFDSYTDYESYPTTEYVEGDKSFGELKSGNIIYGLEYLPSKDGYKWNELEVNNEWHEAKGHCYLGYTDGKTKKNINFGPSNCANVFHYAKSHSIIWYKNMIIGTNKKSVYEKLFENLNKKFEETKKEYEWAKKRIHLLENVNV